MNIFILMAALVIWLVAVSFVMPLSTLITTRPIGFSIVLALFSLFGLVLLFADHKEEHLDSADDTVGIADDAPPGKIVVADGDTTEDVTYPLLDIPLHDGLGG